MTATTRHRLRGPAVLLVAGVLLMVAGAVGLGLGILGVVRSAPEQLVGGVLSGVVVLALGAFGLVAGIGLGIGGLVRLVLGSRHAPGPGRAGTRRPPS